MSSIRQKIFLAASLLIILVLISGGWILFQIVREDQKTYAFELGNRMAAGLAADIATRLENRSLQSGKRAGGIPPESFWNLVFKSAGLQSEPVRISQNDGQTIFSRGLDQVLAKELSRLVEGSASAVGCRSEQGTEMLCVRSDIRGTDWSVAVSFPMPTALSSARRIIFESWWQLLLLIGAAMAISLFLARHITRPLADLVLATRTIGLGDFNVLLSKSKVRSDEVGNLVAGFQEMATRLKQRDREIETVQVRLHQSGRLAAMGQISAGIAHEIKNPLTSILGFAKLLKNSERLSAEQSEAADIIFRETRRCSEILNGLLSFAKQDESRFAMIDLNDAATTVIRLVRHEFKKKNVELTLKQSDHGIVNGSMNQLQQVIINLLLNALDVSNQGQAVKVHLISNEKEVRCSVMDQGPGISAEIQGRLYEPFFTTKPSGTGLGLSISYGIIQFHGGRIEAENNSDGGACVSFVLPRIEDGRAIHETQNATAGTGCR